MLDLPCFCSIAIFLQCNDLPSKQHGPYSKGDHAGKLADVNTGQRCCQKTNDQFCQQQDHIVCLLRNFSIFYYKFIDLNIFFVLIK